jgi:hypothetical protein
LREDVEGPIKYTPSGVKKQEEETWKQNREK